MGKRMSKYFVPFIENHPAAVEVNGHRLLLVSTSAEEINEGLTEIGGKEVRELDLKPSEEETVLAGLAQSIRGGIVLTPPGIQVRTMLKSLEAQLPWVH